ncbi:MAG TPA: hypothetical protein PKJ41_19955 [Bryobacteraceae bacterium]|nr:hypothetical protein [Bryobacteraceae bacterium]HPT24796.1 hypothetical protein [Bryobacteraceae bacterium]
MHCLQVCAVAALAMLAGCSNPAGGTKTGSEKTYVMGAPAAVGPLSYTVLHSEWADSLETGDGVTMPKNRFLVLDLSIVSGAPEETGVPLLSLVDDKGNRTMEEQKMVGLGGWLGMLRVLRPVETLSGKIVFDVPMANYKLIITSGGDPEKEQEAFVDIPLRLEGVSMPGADAVPPAAK